MFTTPCFIRKVNQEIIDGLDDLGIPYASLKDDGDVILVAETLSIDIDKGIPISERVAVNAKSNDKLLEYIIDCGTNKTLFLAIAALRDDSDINQWFVSSDNCWFYSTEYSYTVLAYDYFGIYDDTKNFHKATVKELIEHFKDK